MGERDKGDGRAIRLPSGERAAATREREHKLRMLKRLADTLGRPVEDFFKSGTISDAAGSKANEEE
jgi:hypothetical protein